MQQFVDVFGLTYDPRYLYPLLRLVSLLLVGLVTLGLLDSVFKRLVAIVPAGTSAEGALRGERRAETLRHIVRSVGKGVLGFVFVFYLAMELGFDLAPLLASAGIAGLAIGFGAQSLVKDVIAGFLVLLEDQYGVGDIVRIGNQEGTVEEMSLRVTVLRSKDGEIHVIPNGNVLTVTVLSRDWRRAVVDVSVSQKENLGRVFDVLAAVGAQVAKDLPQDVIEAPSVVGIQRFSGTGTAIRVAAKTIPSKHEEVTQLWRRRIKESLAKEGIELAGEVPEVPAVPEKTR